MHDKGLWVESHGRLPRPRGKPSALVLKAVTLYNRHSQLRNPDCCAARRRHYTMLLDAAIKDMTPGELSHYYRMIRKEKEPCPTPSTSGGGNT